MIPEAAITQWRSKAPWPTDNQVEQDLILSRLIVEIANHDVLGPELVFRGGTCLHKLQLPEPLRYSEDLDYCRRTSSGIKPYLTALREVAEEVGLQEHGTEQSGQMVHIIFDTDATHGGRIRIKIETNIREINPFLPYVEQAYEVDSDWWRGEGTITIFETEESLGTKMRALYQRSKGRDLFDLWHSLSQLNPDEQQIIGALSHYMGETVFSYRQFADNLEAKLEDGDFGADLSQLLVDTPAGYELDGAADVLMERLGSKLKNAPSLDEIKNGAWRRAASDAT